MDHRRQENRKYCAIRTHDLCEGGALGGEVGDEWPLYPGRL